jgi:hypothetical protein
VPKVSSITKFPKKIFTGPRLLGKIQEGKAIVTFIGLIIRAAMRDKLSGCLEEHSMTFERLWRFWTASR